MIQTWYQRLRLSGDNKGDGKLSAFAGVFTPTTLTILGAIMYLRLGWVVGNTGLLGAIAIILLAHMITISTALSVSSVVTNTQVGAGGAFAIISRALGLEVGGAVGVPLYLAQAISVALYILAFSEAWLRIFPSHSLWLVSILSFLIVSLIAYISTQFAARTQFIILAIVGFSLFSIFLGSFAIAGRPGFAETPVLIGNLQDKSFWDSFAIFFPAVTGIMAGISLSGALRDPRTSIPKGTMSSITLTLAIYLLLAYWLSRVATTDELLTNSTIMVDKAFLGWAVLAGMLGATFSSGLGSIVAAPRVMQALAVHKIVPFSALLAQQDEQGEPRQAMLMTAGIAFITLVLALTTGDEALNSVADIITMLFLITYGMLNLVVLVEQMLQMVSFRPTFKISRLFPLLGLVGCLFVMVLVNPLFSLLASVFVVGLYAYLTNRSLVQAGSDVRSGLFKSLAEWAATKANRMPSAPERTWKPSILVPLSNTSTLVGSYRFLWAMSHPQGAVYPLAIRSANNEEQLHDIELLTDAFITDGIHGRAVTLDADDFVDGVRVATQVLRSTLFRPNILFLHLHRYSDLEQMQELVDKTAAYRMGVVLLARHPVLELGREQVINVWISAQRPEWNINQSLNRDLSILMAYQLAHNWKGQINLCMAVDSEPERAKAVAYLSQLITLARLPATTDVQVAVASFRKALDILPRADLNVFGLPPQPDLHFCQELTQRVNASCVFVRDSGEESALV